MQLVWLPLTLLTGCVPDASGLAIEAETRVWDVALVMDASSSMSDEAAVMIVDLDILMESFVATEARIGVLTVDVAGTAGGLVGMPIDATDGDATDTLREQIACQATCWQPSQLPSDPDYACGDPLDEVSVEYLDCLCDTEDWSDGCGGGQEEGLEALLLALCRATGGVHEACTEDLSPLSEEDFPDPAAGSWLRADTPVLAIVISDEGDDSRRLVSGDEDPQGYAEIYDALGLDVHFAAIGPDYDPEEGGLLCDGGATEWGVERYLRLAQATGFDLYPLAELNEDQVCEEVLAESLVALGAAMLD